MNLISTLKSIVKLMQNFPRKLCSLRGEKVFIAPRAFTPQKIKLSMLFHLRCFQLNSNLLYSFIIFAGDVNQMISSVFRYFFCALHIFAV